MFEKVTIPEEKRKKRINIFLVLVALYLLFTIGMYSLPPMVFTENQCKKYIIENQNKIVDRSQKYDDLLISCEIISDDLSYFTDVQFRLYKDSTYDIIFWGDRNSWKWDFRTDKHFHVYDLKTKQDTQIVKILQKEYKKLLFK